MTKFILKHIYQIGFKRGVRFGFKEGFSRGAIKGKQRLVTLNHRAFGKYIDLHKKILKFAVKVNENSHQKYNPPAPKCNKNILVRGCLYKIGEWVVILHRAVLSLCDGGWASVTPILLRSMLDCLVNTIAILSPENDSEYMAFKFNSLDFLNSMLTERDGSVFDFNKQQVDETIKIMNPENQKKAKDYVQQFLKRTERKSWWFKPEYKNTKQILEKCNKGFDVYFLFQVLSMAVHSAYFGFGLFKDEPDRADINPRPDYKSTKRALIFSSRLLLEISNIRNKYEELNCSLMYENLKKELLAFKKDDSFKSHIKLASK